MRPTDGPEFTRCSWCEDYVGLGSVEIEMQDGERFLELFTCSWAHAAAWFAQGEPPSGPWTAEKPGSALPAADPRTPDGEELVCTWCAIPVPYSRHLSMDVHWGRRELEPGFCTWDHAAAWFLNGEPS